MSTKAERQQEWKQRHLKALTELGFTGSYHQLRLIEERARRSALRYCNDSTYNSDEFEAVKDKARADVAKLFGGKLPVGFRLNSDPRGSALQLDSELTTIPNGLHRNFGGNGVLAPSEF